MADLADKAQQLIEQQQEDALRRHRRVRGSPPSRSPLRRAEEGRACRDCQEPIEPERLKAHLEATRCIWCQRDAELGGG